MARFIVDHPSDDDFTLKRTEDGKQRLTSWLSVEVEDGISSMTPLIDVMTECLRQYEGVPKEKIVNTPVANAPNVEVTLGAIAADSINAQAVDTILTIDPLVTIRPTSRGTQEDADALQDLARHVAIVEAKIGPAAEDTILDDVQLGTGFYYIPWIEEVVKKRAYQVRTAGPRIISMPIEDVIVPAGSTGDLDEIRWLGLRFWLTHAELVDRANLRGWDIEGCSPASGTSTLRERRQNLGHTDDAPARNGDLYEIIDLYCQFDIDDDGIEEDLFVVWDRTSHKILTYDYNPYERRPGAVMRYQKRAHLFHGIGVLEMIMPYQDEVSKIHNWRNLNMRLANARIWKTKTGALAQGFMFWENRRVDLDNPREDLIPEQMGDIYPSSAQAEAISTGLASRRVGEIEQNFSRPSSLLGSRTPGITALSALQQINRRFTAAFNAMREATAEAIKQCLYRYQERVMAGDEFTIQHLREICSEENAERLLTLLRNPNFDDGYLIEMTASSASINKMADRQDAMLLVQVLTQYYGGLLQMMQLIALPETPPPVKAVAQKIAEAASNVIERVIRTFDQIRDPEAFVIEIEGEVDAAMAGANPGVVQQLAGLLGGLGGQAGQGALPSAGSAEAGQPAGVGGL